MLDLKILHSESNDPWYNLALEEYLFNNISSNEVILYLWQNDHTVVIGRNQNAWKECRCRQLEEDGGQLARRLSGGGAVYHDLGNLNFTFLMDKKIYDLEKQLEVILQAVRELGIEAEFSGRNDLVVEGKKFSGNAFYFTADKAYHHGTLLVDTDYNQLVNYLQVSEDKIKAKGVESVRSRVVNLKNINKEITIKKLKKTLQKCFVDIYPGNLCSTPQKYNPEEMSDIKELYNKYSSWEWRFGQTPEFDIKFDNRFSWGGIELGFSLKDGHIEDVSIFSDAMDVAIIRELKSSLKGLPFKKNVLINKIDSLKNKENLFQYKGNDKDRDAIIRDIKDWLKDKEI